MIIPDFSGVELKLKRNEGKTSVWDIIRKKWIILTPEEHVRQYMIHYLTNTLKYPLAMLAVEKTIIVGGMRRRFDIVVYNRNHTPWMLVECKAPDVAVTPAVLHQLLGYQSKVQSSFWLLTNGIDILCADARNSDNIIWLDLLPLYEF